MAQMISKPALSIEAAKKIIAAAMVEARRDPSKPPVSITIVDESGALIYFGRLDHTGPVTAAIAVGKARAAALFARPSKVLEEMIDKQGRTGFTTMTNTALGHDIVMVEGGLPIIYDGRVVGGIGICGRSGGEDEAIGRAGLAALK